MLRRSLVACLQSSSGRGPLSLSRRQLLSPAYACQSEWDSRLSEPVFASSSPHSLLNEVEQKFLPAYYDPSYVGAVDVDLVVQLGAAEPELSDRIARLLYALRHTPSTAATLPSTHHALVRAALANGATDPLLAFLKDPINVGFFPDPFACALLLDHLLQKEDYPGGSDVAVYLMRQEMWDAPVPVHLALLHVLRLLESRLQPTPETETAETAAAEQGDDDDEEEIMFKVPWLKNRFSDGHFDLEAEMELLGKALAWLPDPANSSPLIRSIRLLGYALWAPESKEATEFLATLQGTTLSVPPHFKELITRFGQGGPPKEPELGEQSPVPFFGSAVLSFDSEASLSSQLEPEVGRVAAECESTDASEMRRLFVEWGEERSRRLSLQVKRLGARLQMERLEEEAAELSAKEEEVDFFRQRLEWEKAIRPEQLAAAEAAETGALPSDDDYRIPDSRRRVLPSSHVKRVGDWATID